LISDHPKPINDLRITLAPPQTAVSVMHQLKNGQIFDEDVIMQIASYFELNNDCFVQHFKLPKGTTFVNVAFKPELADTERVTSISNDYRVEVHFPGGLKHTLVSNIFRQNAAELVDICNRNGLGLDWIITVHRNGEVIANPRVSKNISKLAFADGNTQPFKLAYLFEASGTPAKIILGKLSEPIKPYFPKPKPTDTFGPGTLPWRYGFASTVNVFRRSYATRLLKSP
jgi:hypothetical protein